MRKSNFKVFDVYDARDLTEGLIVSIHRDVGCLYGTITEVKYYESEDMITIILNNIITDPEEKSFYSPESSITFEFSGDKKVKVKVPLTEILKNL